MEIKLCGVGGQGLGLAGRLLGEAAIEAGLHAAQTTAYGVESRGGMSTSDVIISPQMILFPEVRRPDALLIMAEKGLQANLSGTHDRTLILFDSGTVSESFETSGRKHPFPFLELALKEFGNGGAATIIGLGTLAQMTEVLPLPALIEAVKRRLPPKVRNLNIEALQAGAKLALGSK
jgi:2-oxoglutarate ferredoxin oxidoreductase subunit gamma